MYYYDDATKTKLNINRDVTGWLKKNNQKDPENTFKIAINEYHTGNISLDDLSCIFGFFYDKLSKNMNYSSSIIEILEIGSELSYLERFSKNFSSELQKVLKFSEQTKIT